MSMTLLHAQDFPEALKRHAVRIMAGEPAPGHRVQAQAPALDNERVAYLLRVRPGFDLLRDALSQAAAILLLIVAGSRDAHAHPMRAVIEAHAAEAREDLCTLKVPREARHGHSHLLASSSALDDALCAMNTRDAANVHGRIYEAIERGLRELRFAAGHLPGLEIVSGAEACVCHESPRIAG